MQNIKDCFNGSGPRGLDFISPNMNCVSTKLTTISEDFCGLDVNSPLGGEKPIASVPVAIFATRATAVAATSTSSFTVVFVGTENGKIKKIVVEGVASAQEYDEVKIDAEGGAIGKDLFFDKKEMNLYVMTRKRVSLTIYY